MEFTPVRTIPIVFVLIVLVVAVEVQGCFLLVLTCTYLLLRAEHKRIRQSGFLRFYIKANKYIRTVYFIVSVSLSFLCVIYLFYPNNSAIERSTLMDVLVTLEMLCVLVLLILYIQMCWQFNKTRSLPDAHQWQQSQGIVNYSIQDSLLSGPRGARSVVHKQALMIRHLDKQLRILSDELQKLKAQSKFSSITNRRSEFDFLLSAKDQEIRSLKVDRDRLRQECKQTAIDLDSLAAAHNMIQKEHEECIKELERIKNQMRSVEKEKAQLQILVEVHKETNTEMQKMLDSLRSDDSGSEN